MLRQEGRESAERLFLRTQMGNPNTYNTQLPHITFPFQLLDRWAFCRHALSCTRELLGKFGGPEMQTDGLLVGFEDPGVTVMCSQGLFAF